MEVHRIGAGGTRRGTWLRWAAAAALTLLVALPRATSASEMALEEYSEANGSSETTGVPSLSLPEDHADVRAHILIPARPDSVWQVLTDYDHLREFIPNLVESRLLEDHGSIKLIEQVAEGRWLVFGKKARVVLEVEEHKYSRLDFHVVDGDFSVFDGSFELHPQKGGHATLLTYRLNEKPRFMAPGFVVRKVLSNDIPVRLAAIRDRVVSQAQVAGIGGAPAMPTGAAR